MCSEVRLVRTLVREGFRALAAGRRNQTHDLEILSAPPGPMSELGRKFTPGRYEVKELRANKGGKSYDRRFKTGTRGTRMYGRRDALIKAAALELEGLDDLGWELAQRIDAEVCTPLGPATELLAVAHDVMDDALEDRHSVRFQVAFEYLCKTTRTFSGHLPAVEAYLEGSFGIDQIIQGYSDLEGIFIIRGDTYTLIKRDEIPQKISFDSKSCEGLKLKVLGVVSDTNGRSGKVKGKK